MKKIILLFAVLAITFANAQKVGINTNVPKRTLDVNGDFGVKTLEDKSQDSDYSNILIQNPKTGFIDAFPKSDLLSLEPWNVLDTKEKATLNTQNIYQSGRVALFPNKDRISVLGGTESLNITMPSSSGIRLQTSDGNNNYNSIQYLDLLETSGYGTRLVSNSGSGVSTYETGWPDGETDPEGFKILMRNSTDGSNSLTSIKIVQQTANVGLSTNDPTQKLDVNGNVRIRILPNANGKPAIYTGNVVSDSRGVLGYVDRTTDYQPITYSASISSDWNATDKSAGDFYPVIIGSTNLTQTNGLIWRVTGGLWEYQFDKTSNNSIANIQVIWIRK